MIRIKADHANREVHLHLEKTSLFFREGIRNALFEIGDENSKQLKKFIIDPPHTGIIYNRPGNMGQQHQASAPGESPADMTGKLSKSVNYKVRGSYEVEFGEKMPYGKYLEEGTAKIQPRPHLIRTVRKKERDNYRSLERNVRQKIAKP